MIYLRQSTASQEVILGPFLDDTDGKTAETGLTIANTDIKIWKTGGTTESDKNSGGATHIASGRYYAVLDATDTNTIGPLEVNVHVSGALPVKVKCCVLDEAVFDVLFGTTAPSTYAGGDTSGTTTLLSRIGGAITITSGRVNANITHIAAAAVSTSTAQLGVNVVNFGGSAGTFASGRPAVNASYIGGVPVTATTSITFPSTCTVATTTGAVGSVTGAVGSVTGTVGSVTGNVGGNVVGSVGSIATGGITAASFAAGAIDAAAIANGAIDAATFAADVDAEILSYLVDDATRIDASALNTATGTTIPTNLDAAVSTRATPAQVNTEVDTALADIHLDHLLATTYDPASKPGAADALLNELVESDAGVARFTANALEQAPTGGSAPTASEIADAVWDEAQADHVSAGSFGVIASEIADILTDTADIQPKIGTPTDFGSGASTLAANLQDLADNGTATYDRATDSLQALRDRGDAAWITATGFSTHSAADVWSVGTRVLTAGTNIVLPSNGLSGVTAWTVDITGSLSGSVGSVTGNVGGNVTGSVGSVTGNVGGDVAGKVLGGGSGTITGTGSRADLRAWNGTAPGNLDSNGYVPSNLAAVNGNLTRAANLASACDNYSATRGLTGTAVPAVAAGSAGGLPTDSAGKTSFNDPTAATTATAVRSELTTELGRIDAAISTRLASASYTAPLDAAGTRTAVGLASANLDTQIGTLATAANLATVDTVVDGIKAKTDNLTFTVAGQVDSNVQYVNDTQIGGTGASGNEWGPA